MFGQGVRRVGLRGGNRRRFKHDAHKKRANEAADRTTTHLVDLVRQLGQDGDAYDAVFDAIL